MSDWTPERHDAAKAACEAATPGPWEWAWQHNCSAPQIDETYAVVEAGRSNNNSYRHEDYLSINGGTCRIAQTHSHRHGGKNAKFIALARTELPAALARIEELEPLEAAMDEQDGIISDLKARILELETRGVPLEKFDKVAEVNVTYEAELSNLLAAFGETKSRLDASLNRNTALEARVAELEADNKNVSFNSAGLMEICEKHMARITELEAMTTVGSPTERYPTVWAYEMSCETIRKREARIAELEADSREVDAWKKLEAELRSCRDEVGFVLVDVIEEQKIMDALTELDEIRRQK